MSTYRVISIVESQPTFEKPLTEILADLKEGGAIKLLSPVDYHTDRQRRWYKGICLRGLADWSGNTPGEWDLILKASCGGSELLKSEEVSLPQGRTVKRLTIVGVGKRNMTAFIENILSKAITENWPVTPPDKDLRK